MKRALLLTVCMAAIAAISQAQQTTVNVETAGTLSEQIGSDKYTITSLKITGNLNGTDFILLRDMAGIDLDNVPTEGKLATLDLSEAKVVAGGEAYYTDYVNNKEFYTSDNEMGNCIFYSCDKLESLSLPAGTTVVGDSAFMRCTALSEITLPDGLKEIRSYAFSETQIASFSFVNGIMPAKGMFRNCGKLTSVTLPEECEEIPANAFSGTTITEITLPKNLVKNRQRGIQQLHAYQPRMSGNAGRDRRVGVLYVQQSCIRQSERRSAEHRGFGILLLRQTRNHRDT